MSGSDLRRAPRRHVKSTIPVENVITGQRIGHLGNVSASGMMLISHEPLHADAIYQLRMPLPDGAGRAHAIEFGVHEQWSEPAAVPGQYWTGFRIIAIADADAAALEAWLTRPGAGSA